MNPDLQFCICGFCGLYSRNIDEDHVYCPIKEEARDCVEPACGHYIDEEEFVMFGGEWPLDCDLNDDIF